MTTTNTLAGTDPVTIAWTAAGSPHLLPPTDAGDCARCAKTAPLTRTTTVVSRSYTALEGWSVPTSWGLCPACVWALRHPPLRLQPHLITRDPPALTAVTCPQLRRILADPIGANTAVTVPSRPGRKHILPTASWARVSLDDTNLTWTPADTTRLTILESLRRRGTPARALTDPGPPWTLLRTLPGPQQATVLRDWNTLAPWRARPPWLHLAILATNQPTAGGR